MSFREREQLQEPEHYPDKPVRFSMAKCDTNKYCITKLGRNELAALYGRLGHFEQMTWGNFAKLPRANGISIDKKSSAANNLMARMVPGLTYGHFRVTGINANTRVFVARDRDLAKILIIDRTGELQH